MNKSFDFQQINSSKQNESLELDDLINSTIDVITSKIQKKHNQQRERSTSIPKLDFKNVKEFQEQDWLSYSKKLEESIKVLNQRIHILEDENDKVNRKYYKVVNSNNKLYELNEKLNQALKTLKEKINEQKRIFKEKLQNPKECSFCHNMV